MFYLNQKEYGMNPYQSHPWYIHRKWDCALFIAQLPLPNAIWGWTYSCFFNTVFTINLFTNKRTPQLHRTTWGMMKFWQAISHVWKWLERDVGHTPTPWKLLKLVGSVLSPTLHLSASNERDVSGREESYSWNCWKCMTVLIVIIWDLYNGILNDHCLLLSSFFSSVLLNWFYKLNILCNLLAIFMDHAANL